MKTLLYKPRVGCLLCHQPAWTFEGTYNDEDVYHCFHCDEFFYYPSKKTRHPVYRKFFHKKGN